MTPIEYRTLDELLEELLAIETLLELFKLRVESIRNFADFNKEELQNNKYYKDRLKMLIQNLSRDHFADISRMIQGLEKIQKIY